ncbi:hypothetical protein [Streptomyces sp. NPDC048521]
MTSGNNGTRSTNRLRTARPATTTRPAGGTLSNITPCATRA